MKKTELTINQYVILLALAGGIYNYTATLELPTGNAERGVEAGKIITKCTDNANVTIDPLEITDANDKLTAYNGATPSNRKSRWRNLHNVLKKFMGYFQAKADSLAENAEEIIKSGGFGVKKIAIPQNHVFAVKNGNVSGTVLLTAEGGGQGTAHDWWYSLDNITWTRMVPTIHANTMMEGLEPKTTVYFNHQLITGDGPDGLEGVISIVII